MTETANPIQGEMDKLIRENPPGSPQYKVVEPRVAELSRKLTGESEGEAGTPSPPEPVSGAGGSDAQEAGPSEAETVKTARAGVEHVVSLDRDFANFLVEPDEAGEVLGDDADMIAVAADYADLLENRFGDDWDSSASPPAVPDDVVADTRTCLSALGPEGAQVLRELGGSNPQELARGVGYVLAASQLVAETRPELFAKLMASDPDQPGRLIADRPSVIRAAHSYGRLLVHGQRSQQSKGKGGAMGDLLKDSAADREADQVAELHVAKINALASGDRDKARRIDARLSAYYTKRVGSGPIVGRGGRNV